MSAERPVNETPEDLEREAAVGKALSNAWQARAKKLDKFEHADFLMIRDGVPKSLVEVKCRDELREPMWISKKKFEMLKEMSELQGVPAIIVYSAGGLWFHVVDPEREYKTGWGYNKRGQPGDKELMVLIPKRDLRRVRHA